MKTNGRLLETMEVCGELTEENETSFGSLFEANGIVDSDGGECRAEELHGTAEIRVTSTDYLGDGM